MDTKYMMATKAMHKTGDISRAIPDLCVVTDLDAENYIGNWVTGFGFVEVKFPKATTRELTFAEIEKYHGMPLAIGEMLAFINLTDEKVGRPVKLTKKEDGKTAVGNLMSPLKIGGVLYLIDPATSRTFKTSTIQSINGNEVKTRNSTYTIEYV